MSQKRGRFERFEEPAMETAAFSVTVQLGSLQVKLTGNLTLVYPTPAGEERVLGHLHPVTGEFTHHEVVDPFGARAEASDDDDEDDMYHRGTDPMFMRRNPAPGPAPAPAPAPAFVPAGMPFPPSA